MKSNNTSNEFNIFKNLKYDFPSGLVVFLVALPLCLGVALASTGRTDLLFSGIIAGAVGGIIVGMFSGSALGVSGPAAGLVTIVLGAINGLGSFELFLTAVVVAGIFQLIMGFLKAGTIGYFFPSSVIRGMLAAIGVILILKQFPHAMGFDADFEGNESFVQADGHNVLTELYYAVRYSSPGAVIIAAVSLIMLVLFDMPAVKKIGLFKFLPGALFVVIAGTLLNLAFQHYFPNLYLSGDHVVQLPVANTPSDVLSFFTFPDWSGLANYKVYVIALTIAIVASLETLLSVEAADKLDPYKRITPTNKELLAQGTGNIVSGMIGGLPVTQVIVRSSANITSGARTKMATIIHGTILLASVIIIPKYLNYIPLSALATILLMVGFKLTKPSLYKGMFNLGWQQFFPFIVTVFAVVGSDLLKGIFLGLIVAMGFIMLNYGRLKIKRSFKNVFKAYDVGRENNMVHIKLASEVNFFNKASISKLLMRLPERSTIFIDGSQSKSIDYDVLEILQEFEHHTAATKNIKVITKGIDKVTVVGGH
ncbi:MAG: SulP family inorganic anion transporter [Bacteroidetes bacterium]|nr:SulP family inorganic anion transporter [Bacteroidota bacterium]